MAKERYSFALENELLLEYLKFIKPEKFSEGDKYNPKIIKSLLSYRVLPFIYGSNQVEELNIDLDTTWKRQADLKNQTLNVLASRTFFKGILSKDKDYFPFVKIGGSDKVTPSISGSFYYKEPRVKAIEHIKALCSQANKILVWDPYLTKDVDAITALTEVLPQNQSVSIVLHNGDINGVNGLNYDHSSVESLLHNTYQWTIMFEALKVNQHHDRYLIIDDEKQVILTSGLAYLINDNKEITYAIKPYCPHF